MQPPTCNNNTTATRVTPMATEQLASLYAASFEVSTKRKNELMHISVANRSARSRQGKGKRASRKGTSPIRTPQKTKAIDRLDPRLAEDIFLSLICPEFTLESSSNNRRPPDEFNPRTLQLSLDTFPDDDSSLNLNIVGLPASDAFDIVTMLDSPKLSDNNFDSNAEKACSWVDVSLDKEFQDTHYLEQNACVDGISDSSNATDRLEYLLGGEEHNDVDEILDLLELPADITDLEELNVDSADEFSLFGDLEQLSFDEEVL